MAHELTKRVENLEFALVLDMERVMLVGNDGVSEPRWQMPLDNLPFFGDTETSSVDSAPYGWESVDGGVEDELEAFEGCEACPWSSPDGCTAAFCDCRFGIPF